MPVQAKNSREFVKFVSRFLALLDFKKTLGGSPGVGVALTRKP